MDEFPIAVIITMLGLNGGIVMFKFRCVKYGLKVLVFPVG